MSFFGLYDRQVIGMRWPLNGLIWFRCGPTASKVSLRDGLNLSRFGIGVGSPVIFRAPCVAACGFCGDFWLAVPPIFDAEKPALDWPWNPSACDYSWRYSSSICLRLNSKLSTLAFSLSFSSFISIFSLRAASYLSAKVSRSPCKSDCDLVAPAASELSFFFSYWTRLWLIFSKSFYLRSLS